jgi:hypothetical protein
MLLDGRDAKSIKADGAFIIELAIRLKASIITAMAVEVPFIREQKNMPLRDFSQQFHKVRNQG